MTSFIKKNSNRKYYNGLNTRESFELEKNCLEIINSNFKCICGLKCYHFPKLLSYNSKTVTMKLSHCGISMDKYSRHNKPIIIKNMNEQINCIIYNLKNNKIKHHDMHLSGKNLCLNSNGIISVIDFDIATINDEDRSPERVLARHRSHKHYTHFKDAIIKIINSKKHNEF